MLSIVVSAILHDVSHNIHDLLGRNIPSQPTVPYMLYIENKPDASTLLFQHAMHGLQLLRERYVPNTIKENKYDCKIINFEILTDAAKKTKTKQNKTKKKQKFKFPYLLTDT